MEGSTLETASMTIDDALLQINAEATEIVIVGEGRLGEGVGVWGGYFGLSGETSMKTQLKVNGKRSGQTDGIVGGLHSAELGLHNLRMTEIAASDGLSGFLVFLSDASLWISRCSVEASESLGVVHSTGQSSVDASELTMRRAAFASSAFLLVDESSLSLTDSTWTELRASTGSLVDVSGWLTMNVEVSGVTISDCVCADTSKALFSIRLSAWTERERRQIVIKGSSFAGSALSSPFVHVTGNGLGCDLLFVSTTMRWTGWTPGLLSRTGTTIVWTERQPLVVRRGLKMENCAFVVKKL
ncbi:hypothetical protein BLNAU_22152 [Blattamonas nauphoetae]|uniref:Dispersed gene family protein 1 (DGF-1) n=1 Tax=Blattamonas nauphoetae TaxID=2049346 RepID=A0ABQ9WWZ3_9EUKA|nr:hypothetical protein BLNAU_22152 [Blattamonas nauphoetae]